LRGKTKELRGKNNVFSVDNWCLWGAIKGPWSGKPACGRRSGDFIGSDILPRPGRPLGGKFHRRGRPAASPQRAQACSGNRFDRIQRLRHASQSPKRCHGFGNFAAFQFD
jgi:hypothetical protein